MAKEFYVSTWGCLCGYVQDFEPTKKNNAIHFPEVAVGTCPSCGDKETFTPIINNEKKVKIRVLEEADIEAMDLHSSEKSRMKIEAAASFQRAQKVHTAIKG